jgi:hypothetical protein
MNRIKNLLLCLLAICTLLSCNDDDVNPGSKRLRVYEQSAVQEDFPLVTSGDALVFHLNRSTPDRKDVIDDEFSEDFLLQISTEENSFSYSSNTLASYDLPVVYRQYCFCGGFNQVVMTQFDFEGARLSNDNWLLSGDVTLSLQYFDDQTQEVVNEWAREINISGLYIKSSRPK